MTMRQLLIDYKKAYDSVKREVIYNILLEFCIPKKLVPVWWLGNRNSPTVTHACRKRRLKWVATLPLGDINTETWSSGMGLGVGLQPYPVKRKLLRSLQEIQPDFVDETKA
jgi:hypothetical protein